MVGLYGMHMCCSVCFVGAPPRGPAALPAPARGPVPTQPPCAWGARVGLPTTREHGLLGAPPNADMRHVKAGHLEKFDQHNPGFTTRTSGTNLRNRHGHNCCNNRTVMSNNYLAMGMARIASNDIDGEVCNKAREAGPAAGSGHVTARGTWRAAAREDLKI